METNKEIKKLGLLGSFAIYIPASILMYLSTKYLIPWLSNTTGMEVILCWFIVAGLLIFTPLIITGLLILKNEGYSFSKSTWAERLRFRKLTNKDLIWNCVGLLLVGLLSVLIVKGMELFLGKFDHTPDFMTFEPLTKGRFWLLLVWVPYWLLNILGEEFLWRGVMLPRQEVVFGKYTWLVHGFGWGIFHIAFGWQLLITLIPLIFIQSYLVQKTKNSSVGVLMHAAINGPSFIAISLGLI